jgi:hypothetical protein
MLMEEEGDARPGSIWFWTQKRDATPQTVPSITQVQTMTEHPRRFPPPWDIEEHDQSCFIVRDNNGMALAYVYFETDAGRRTAAIHRP